MCNKRKTWKAGCFDLRGNSTEAFLVELVILTAVMVVVGMNANCVEIGEVPLVRPVLVARFEIFGQT